MQPGDKMRDIEDMMLNSLVTVIADGTGISSGNIWLLMPEPEFVNKRSGSIDGSTNTDYLPSIGITYMKDATIKHNNYGESRYEDVSSGIIREFKPLGELHLSLAIHLYTMSHADMNTYGTLLYQTLLSTRSVDFESDSVTGEYFNVLFKSMRYVNYEKPIHKIFFIETCGRILSESTGYIVDTLITNVDTYDEFYVEVVTGAIVTVTSDD